MIGEGSPVVACRIATVTPADAATARDRALAFLAARRNADGSWGYLPGQAGLPEPTLLAAAAGAEVSLDWLAGAPLGWTELLLPAALSRRAEAAALRDRALATIRSLVGVTGEADRALIDQDLTIPGWPWVADTVAWVEPTAYAMLSLKRTGHGDEPRVRDGERLLADRQCADGGFNYGNPRVRGLQLEGDLSVTGWAAMAMAPGPACDRALEFLMGARAHPSASTLSLAVLARVARGRSVEDLPERLVARQADDGSYGGRCDRTALAACALGAVAEGTHAFAA